MLAEQNQFAPENGIGEAMVATLNASAGTFERPDTRPLVTPQRHDTSGDEDMDDHDNDERSFCIRPTIDPSVVTGPGLRVSAGATKGLRYDIARGFVGAQGHARLARFVWLMGASDEWRTAGRSFEELCATLDMHIGDRILPKCEPTRPFLPDATGRGWRADLGVQPADDTQIDRFTKWMTRVAALGAVSWLDWASVTATINEVTEHRNWNGHGASTTDGWMKAMARDRTDQLRTGQPFQRR